MLLVFRPVSLWHKAFSYLLHILFPNESKIFPTTFQIQKLQIIRLGSDANPNMCSAVVHNGVVTTMGVIDTTGSTIEEQTQNVLDKINALLKEAGTDKSQLLTANIWLQDIGRDFGAMNAVWVQWIDAANKPARACVEANLAFPSLLVEIQVTAAVVGG